MFPVVYYAWFAAISFVSLQASPISNPLLNDQGIDYVIPDYFDAKRVKSFHQRSPNNSIETYKVKFNTDIAECGVEFKLRWAAELSAPVYSTPVIYPDTVDGSRNIFINTLHEHIEYLRFDGSKPWGWPITLDGSTFQRYCILLPIACISITISSCHSVLLCCTISMAMATLTLGQ
jgi:hypothetical protein